MMLVVAAGGLILLLAAKVRAQQQVTESFDDVLVYGATSGGVMAAAVAAARNGVGRVGLLGSISRIGGTMTLDDSPGMAAGLQLRFGEGGMMARLLSRDEKRAPLKTDETAGVTFEPVISFDTLTKVGEKWQGG
jgi:hypothetical protein